MGNRVECIGDCVAHEVKGDQDEHERAGWCCPDPPAEPELVVDADAAHGGVAEQVAERRSYFGRNAKAKELDSRLEEDDLTNDRGGGNEHCPGDVREDVTKENSEIGRAERARRLDELAPAERSNIRTYNSCDERPEIQRKDRGGGADPTGCKKTKAA